jgi:hypothetical protein
MNLSRAVAPWSTPIVGLNGMEEYGDGLILAKNALFSPAHGAA